MHLAVTTKTTCLLKCILVKVERLLETYMQIFYLYSNLELRPSAYFDEITEKEDYNLSAPWPQQQDTTRRRIFSWLVLK